MTEAEFEAIAKEYLENQTTRDKEWGELMVRQCVWGPHEKTEKGYLECCSKPESICTAESKPNFPSPYEPYIVTAWVIFIICGLYFVFRWVTRRLDLGMKISKGIARITLVVQIVLLLGWMLWGVYWIREGYDAKEDEIVFFSIVTVVAWFGPLIVVKVGYWIQDGFNEDKSK